MGEKDSGNQEDVWNLLYCHGLKLKPGKDAGDFDYGALLLNSVFLVFCLVTPFFTACVVTLNKQNHTRRKTITSHVFCSCTKVNIGATEVSI